jgi:hypothetical protein
MTSSAAPTMNRRPDCMRSSTGPSHPIRSRRGPPPGPAAGGPLSPFLTLPGQKDYDEGKSGRFDPTPECPYSYCYAALDDLTARCEVLLRNSASRIEARSDSPWPENRPGRAEIAAAVGQLTPSDEERKILRQAKKALQTAERRIGRGQSPAPDSARRRAHALAPGTGRVCPHHPEPAGRTRGGAPGGRDRGPGRRLVPGGRPAASRRRSR